MLRRSQPLGDESQREENEGEANEDAGAVGAFEIRVDVVNDHREDRDLDSGGPPLAQKSDGGFKHFRGWPPSCGALRGGVWVRGRGRGARRVRGRAR